MDTKQDMDTNQEILNELRSLRRHSQVGAYVAILCIGALMGWATWLQFQRQRAMQAISQSRSAAPARTVTQDVQESVWPSIDAALDRGDNQQALSIAQSYVGRQPGYHYAHACLGNVHVALGDFTNAETAYLRAVELFPSEDHEKMLVAIRKRLARDRGKEAQVK